MGYSCSSLFVSSHPLEPFGGLLGFYGVPWLLESGVSREKKGNEPWERGGAGHRPLLVLEASALPASPGKRVQAASIDLVSRAVFQRVNVFIGFLSFCCKK